MIKIFVGNNWFGIKSALDKEVSEFLKKHDGINIEKIYCPETDFNSVKSALFSVSLFSEDKLVILDKLSFHKQVTDDVKCFLDAVPESTRLIIVESDIDKRSSYYKTLKKHPNFEEYSQLDENGLVKWVIEFVNSKSGKISSVDARYLVSRVGLDQINLENELTKLLQYNQNIDKNSIDINTDEIPTSTIFSLVDTAFSGNLEKAMRFYDEQRAMKVEPQAIFGMLVWQMHVVAVVACASNANTSKLSAETGISSYVMDKSKRIADKMGKAKIIEYLDFIADIEKTSRKQAYNFDDAMRLAIVKLAE